MSSSVSASANAALARLPSVDALLRLPRAVALIDGHGRQLVRDAVRTVLAAARQMNDVEADYSADGLLDRAEAVIGQLLTPKLRTVYNLTGTILHTNLGRAVMPAEAVAAMADVATAPSNLEYDLASGRRGDRDDHIEDLICRLTGAEAAAVVNNNAAAVLLVLNSLTLRRRVLVSRGELVEIGGSFRIPDIMKRAGAKLVEVGTTNRTHLKDFAAALETPAAAVMQIHTSNYAIQGFTKSVPAAELARLAAEKQVAFIVDLGSGTLVDLENYGLPHETTAGETLKAGADLVTFSGDKLLGGPQAGIIAGRKDLVQRVKKNPMRRALRMDKVRLAALAAVLRLYLSPEQLAARLPILRQMTRPESEIGDLAAQLAPALQQRLGQDYIVSVKPVHSQIGSGALPVDLLPSMAISIAATAADRRKDASIRRLESAFRQLPCPVIGRIRDNCLWLDLRTLEDTPAARQAFLHNLDALP